MSDNASMILRDRFDGESFVAGLFYKDNEEQRAGSFRFVRDASRASGSAVELTVAPSGRPSGQGFSERAEVWEHASVRADYGEAAWYAFSLKFDQPPTSDAHRMMVAQWKRAMNPGALGDYSPFLGIRIVRGEFAVTIDSDALATVPRPASAPLFGEGGGAAPAMQRRRAGQTRLLVATSSESLEPYARDFGLSSPDVRVTPRGGALPKPGTDWVEFVVMTKPGPGGNGAIELFANGAWIASATGRIGHESHELGRTQYFKFGPYRESGRSDRWSVRYADFARGPRCEDVAGPEICRQWAGLAPDPMAQAAV
jgi:hypothetical protein